MYNLSKITSDYIDFFVNCRIYVFQLFCAAFSNFSTFRKKTYTFAVGRNTCDSKKWYLCLVIWFMKADIDLLFLLKCQTIWHLEFFIRHKLNFSPLERSQATFFMNKANRRDRSQSDNLKIKGHLPNITVFPSADFQIASVANHDLFWCTPASWSAFWILFLLKRAACVVLH